MAFIVREDGTHFVIPSYRDVLAVQQKSQLKKDIQLLSQSYGDYITLQKKNPNQYEVAFSPDPGYLLGESIWHYFNKPEDMIFCEASPNGTEAILVIVKNGSVYLDGSFPLESIPEELITFLTQQNHFEIFVYGKVPISETPAAGKFSFESSSVKSFKVLDQPVFPTLPLLKIYQLQLVDVVLKAHGIGATSIAPFLYGIIAIAIAWGAWELIAYLMTPAPQEVVEVNPYEEFNTILTSPAPTDELNQFLKTIQIFGTMPGWMVKTFTYKNQVYTVSVVSLGGKTEDLLAWAHAQKFDMQIQQNGVNIIATMKVPTRKMPTQIYPLKEVLAVLIDKIAKVYPGNHLRLDTFIKKNVYTSVKININLTDVSPMTISLIAKQMQGLPLVLREMVINMQNNNLSGSINLEALGS